MSSRLLDRRMWVLVGVGVVVLGLLYFLVIRSQQSELEEIRIEVEEKEAEYVKMSVLSRVIDELQEKKAAISQVVDRFLKTREKEEETLVVPASLMQILRDSKVKMLSISPIGEKAEGELLISSWNISVTSGYHQLGDFVSRLERSIDFNRIDNLNISSSAGSSEYKVQLIVSRISLLKKE